MTKTTIEQEKCMAEDRQYAASMAVNKATHAKTSARVALESYIRTLEARITELEKKK